MLNRTPGLGVRSGGVEVGVLGTRRNRCDHVDQGSIGVDGHEVPLPEALAAEAQWNLESGLHGPGADGVDVVDLDRPQDTAWVTAQIAGKWLVITALSFRSGGVDTSVRPPATGESRSESSTDCRARRSPLAVRGVCVAGQVVPWAFTLRISGRWQR